MNKVQKSDNPLLIIIRGIPGSGKSYIADTLIKEVGIDASVLLDPDGVDYTSDDYLEFSRKLSEDNVDIKLHPYRYLRSKAYIGIDNKNIIVWNQAFTHQDLLNRTIINLKTYAEDKGLELKVLIVEVEISLEIAKTRVKNRVTNGGHNVTEETFDRFIKDYKTFVSYGYDTEIVDGSEDSSLSVSKIIEKINIIV